MNKTIVDALVAYFGGCPLMTGGRMNIDYLPEDTKKAGIEFAISMEPTDEVITRYKDGSARCRYPFIISSVHDYAPGVVQNIQNAGFYEDLAKWIREEARDRRLPSLPEGTTARSLRTMGSGYLYQPDVDSGKYQIQCELEYYRQGDI